MNNTEKLARTLIEILWVTTEEEHAYSCAMITTQQLNSLGGPQYFLEESISNQETYREQLRKFSELRMHLGRFHHTIAKPLSDELQNKFILINLYDDPIMNVDNDFKSWTLVGSDPVPEVTKEYIDKALEEIKKNGFSSINHSGVDIAEITCSLDKSD